MVVVNNPNHYKFIKFQRSNTKNKKYDAIILNKKTKRYKTIPFGDKRYKHYKDTTGLGLYSNLNHLDKNRRKNYRSRHNKTKDNKYSSSYFSYNYLW